MCGKRVARLITHRKTGRGGPVLDGALRGSVESSFDTLFVMVFCKRWVGSQRSDRGRENRHWPPGIALRSHCLNLRITEVSSNQPFEGILAPV